MVCTVYYVCVQVHISNIALKYLSLRTTRLRRENRELLQALQEATEELQARIIRDDETRLDRTVREGVEKWKRLTEDNKDK